MSASPDLEQPGRLDARGILLFASWFAVLTGLGQFLVWVIARDVVHRAIDFDPQMSWMTTAANLVAFAVVALVLLAVARGRDARADLVIGVFAAIAAVTLFLMVPRLHVWALILLGAGIGLQTGRWLAARLARTVRLVRFTTPALFGIVVLLGGTANVRAVLREARAAGRYPPAGASMPNVLLLIWDTVRADHLGLYGYERDTTPVLDALARQSVVFDHAFANAPWTLASHGSLFTGREAFELSANWTVPLDDAWPTLGGVLGSNGWATSAIVANYIFGPPRWGLSRGFDHYRFWHRTPWAVLSTSPLIRRIGRLVSRFRGETPVTPGRRSAANVIDTFLAWQEKQTERPFFAFLNLFDAHDPYLPGAPFDSVLDRLQARGLGTAGDDPTPEVRSDLIDAYDAAIAWMDHETGRLIDALRDRGVLDNTIVIIASDHGELLGEYRLYGHGNSLYAAELHVPLIVRFPHGAHGGMRVQTPVSLREVPATVTSWIGLADSPFPGPSLVRFIPGLAPGDDVSPGPVVSVVPFAPRQPDWFPVSAGDMRSIIVWPDHYIVRGDGREELYDLAADPPESDDRMGAADRARIESLRAFMAAVPEKVTVSHR